MLVATPGRIRGGDVARLLLPGNRNELRTPRFRSADGAPAETTLSQRCSSATASNRMGSGSENRDKTVAVQITLYDSEIKPVCLDAVAAGLAVELTSRPAKTMPGGQRSGGSRWRIRVAVRWPSRIMNLTSRKCGRPSWMPSRPMPGLLEPAEAHPEVVRIGCAHGAGSQPAATWRARLTSLVTPRRWARRWCRCDPDRVVLVAGGDDRQHRPEDLLLGDDGWLSTCRTRWARCTAAVEAGGPAAAGGRLRVRQHGHGPASNASLRR